MKKRNFTYCFKEVFPVLLGIIFCYGTGWTQVSITSFAPGTISAGTKSVLTIDGSGFGTGGPTSTKYVEFRNADDGGATYVKPITSEYILWTDAQIQVEVPSDAGTGTFRVRNGGSTGTSPSSLTVTFSYLNVTSGGLTYQPDHIDDNAAGGYTWRMFTDFDANAGANNAFLRALETWRCATYINWDVGAVTTVDNIASDGINICRFDNGGELPAGVLGRATSRWTACDPGGGYEWWVYELDIVFDDGTAWDFTPPATCSNFEFEAVALHELGHAHQLGHVIDGADVMHYAVGCGAATITLNANNTAGGNAVMANSTAANNCPESPMIALSAGNCALACIGSEPANDAACTPTALPVDGTCVTAQTNYCATSEGYTFGCAITDNTVWYQFTITGVNDKLDVTFTNSTIGPDVELALFDNTGCSPPTGIMSACGDTSSAFQFEGVSAGASPYLLSVTTSSANEGDFDICATESADPCLGAEPVNDAICSSTALPLTGACVTSQTNKCATLDLTFGCSTTDHTVWYTFTVTGGLDQVDITFANETFGGDVELMLFDGACGAATGVTSQCDTSSNLFRFYPLTGGTTYWLSVSTADADTGNFDICATESVNTCTGNQPANDNACSFVTLPVDSTCVTGQTNNCATSQGYTTGCLTSPYTVWYQFTLGATASVFNVTFENYSLGSNVEVAVYDNVCGGPTGISSSCGSPGGMFIFSGLSPLTTYLLAVSTVIADTGGYDICSWESIDCSVSQPSNDSICNALAVPVDGTCLTGQTNICATPDFSSGCVDTLVASVWFSFSITTPANRAYFTFQNYTWSASTKVQTLLAAGPCNSNPLSVLYALCGSPSDTFWFPVNLVSGNTYYVMVATDTLSTGNFDICGREYEVPPATITGPEQDCPGAIPICGPTYYEINAYSGIGTVQEVFNTCLGDGIQITGENNSVWYTFTVQDNGDGDIDSLYFIINTVDLYDWALFDITTIGCAGIPTATPVRCAFSNTVGPTGASVAPAQPKLPPISSGQMGSPTIPGIQVTEGEIYALIIDNWFGNNNGYELNFWGDAIIWDNTPPNMTGAASCATNVIILTFDEQVNCDSIVSGEFKLTNITTGTDYSSAITSVAGFGCPGGGGGQTTQISITHNGMFPTGTYALEINLGVLEDMCGNKAIVGDTVTFSYLLPPIFTANFDTICTSGEAVTLTTDVGQGVYQGSPPSGLTFTLNPGAITNSTGIFTVYPTATTTYTVDVTYGGCTKSASLNITLIDNIVVTINPVDPQICSGTTTLSASTTVSGNPCGSCTFSWSTGETTSSITVGPGTYWVTSSTAEGCASNNTDTSIVSLASAGSAGVCNIWYVSPAGGGDGKTKLTPATLTAALDSAI
ncbi:MAG: hypothetical protein FVQ77_11560, partial [Cytophagales bacterium]|nr:hypothetical protein [Cytophagales bacterium]